MDKHYYIQGNDERGERVIKALERKGAVNMYNKTGQSELVYYYTNSLGGISATECDSFIAQLITSHQDWEELFPEPNFEYRVGDKVRFVIMPPQGVSGIKHYTITELINDHGKPAYKLEGEDYAYAESELILVGNLLPQAIQAQDESQSQFQPFQQVLTRDCNSQRWRANIYSHKAPSTIFPSHVCVSGTWKQCLPYKGNEHLLGTTQNPTK